jgi:hypothetical protein
MKNKHRNGVMRHSGKREISFVKNEGTSGVWYNGRGIEY